MPAIRSNNVVIMTVCDLHFQLALRAGHEKDEETADTVGCCSLRVEHISKYSRLANILWLSCGLLFCVFQRLRTILDVTNVSTFKQKQFLFFQAWTVKFQVWSFL